MEFIFDLETSGLPQGKNSSPTDLEAYSTSRIVSIAWIVIDKQTKNIIQQEYFIVKPNDFVIPESAIKIHGIDNEFAKDYGIEIVEMFDKLECALNRCHAILSYNIKFDYNVLKSELIRNEKTELIKVLDQKSRECIMKLSQHHMAAPFYPKLSEAYKYVFHRQITDAHNAMGDVLSCYKLYKAITHKSK